MGGIRFPWILQRYIFRELRNTLLLTAAALTGLLSLGGGVLNMVKLGEVTPDQFVRLMLLVIPVAVALTLPTAALFSAAATYGRLSADNEFVACRSSGINLHILLLPTIVLSLLAASVTFAFSNYAIPQMIHHLNDFIGADITSVVRQRLQHPRGITLAGKYRIFADHCVVDPENVDRITLRGVAFVEVDGEEWVRYGTAREIALGLDRKTRRVFGSMFGLSLFDRRAGRFLDFEEQPFHPTQLPSAMPMRIKFLTLGKLLHYLSHPGEWGPVSESMDRLRLAAGRRHVYEVLLEQWRRDRQFTVGDSNLRYTLRSSEAFRIPRQGGIELANVTIEEVRQARRRSFTADRATLELEGGDTLADAGIKIELRTDRGGGTGRSPRWSRDTLGPVAIPQSILASVSVPSNQQLLHPPSNGVSSGDPVAKERLEALDTWEETVRRIVATIHERAALSASALVLVFLGAALGIVFRGAHVLTAFGISFIPALVVILAIVTGRQMAHNAGTHGIGLLVMWSGILAVTALDAWIVVRVLRR